MKKVLFTVFICFYTIAVFAQFGTQFDNRGFETWANFGSNNNTNEPVHWHSTKSATGTFSGLLSQQIEPSSQVRPGSLGSKSARIWPVSVVGVTANGNMTNGRMNAGSMSVTGSNNYNYTPRSDERFNTPIHAVPDSLSVWICFRCADPEQKAETRAVIHGDADFRFLSNGNVEPADQLVATASCSFKRTSEAGGSYQWQRISVPFIQNGPCNDPQYILFTVTTNEQPGEGGTADDMFIDDVLLIYNPSIQMGSLQKDHYQIGESLSIPFVIQGTMSPDNLNAIPNQVIAQLSSANGSFSNPIEMGRITASTSGSITVNIPSGIFEGEHYRIRLVTTNYPMISNDNGQDLSITGYTSTNEQCAESIRVFPNPNDGVLYLQSDSEISHISLFTLDGKMVISKHANSKTEELDTGHIAPGLYYVCCNSRDNRLVQKVLVE